MSQQSNINNNETGNDKIYRNNSKRGSIDNKKNDKGEEGEKGKMKKEKTACDMLSELMNIKTVAELMHKVTTMTPDEFITLLLPEWERRNPIIGKGKAPHYLKWLATKPCVICGDSEVQIHHEPPKGMGGGSDDYHALPLCKYHHDYAHRIYDVNNPKHAKTIKMFPTPRLDEYKAHLTKQMLDLAIEYIRRRENN